VVLLGGAPQARVHEILSEVRAYPEPNQTRQRAHPLGDIRAGVHSDRRPHRLATRLRPPVPLVLLQELHSQVSALDLEAFSARR
jgi:hypothetical protein